MPSTILASDIVMTSVFVNSFEDNQYNLSQEFVDENIDAFVNLYAEEKCLQEEYKIKLPDLEAVSNIEYFYKGGN